MEVGGRKGRSAARASSLLCVSFWCCCFFSACVELADAGRTTAHLATGISCGRGNRSTVQSAAAAAAAEASEDGTTAAAARRYLAGPGSYPPRCTSKCGECTPCKPVHVPVPPGTPVITEYYPEAWRCKCGGKLYMP